MLETYHTGNLARLAVLHGGPTEAFDFIATSIRSYFDAGNFALLLASYFDRLGDYEPAAMISGFSTTTFARSYYPEIDAAIAHLREILGNDTYESLARTGATMTNAAMAKYAFEQIDRARANLVDESS